MKPVWEDSCYELCSFINPLLHGRKNGIHFQGVVVTMSLPPSPPHPHTHTHTPHTRDQMCSVGCDVVTGFHVEDWEQHVVVLEGVRGGGVRRVWEELPHHPTQGRDA